MLAKTCPPKCPKPHLASSADQGDKKDKKESKSSKKKDKKSKKEASALSFWKTFPVTKFPAREGTQALTPEILRKTIPGPRALFCLFVKGILKPGRMSKILALRFEGRGQPEALLSR